MIFPGRDRPIWRARRKRERAVFALTISSITISPLVVVCRTILPLLVVIPRRRRLFRSSRASLRKAKLLPTMTKAARSTPCSVRQIGRAHGGHRRPP